VDTTRGTETGGDTMTMRITITNNDSGGRKARVLTYDRSALPEGECACTPASSQDLAEGESCEAWIHAGKSIEVIEVEDVAAAPEATTP
jgi:hypothetical protein